MNSRNGLRSKIKWKKIKTSIVNDFPVPPDASIQGVEFTLARQYINLFTIKSSRRTLSKISQSENKNIRTLCRRKHYYYLNGHRYISFYNKCMHLFITTETKSFYQVTKKER